MFGEDDSATEEIIDDDYSSDLSIVDTNFENSKMCRQLIKALYNTNQYNQNINQIIEDFQIDVELIREKSQIENAANKESMHKPHYNPLYDFDNDVQIPDDFDTNTNTACATSVEANTAAASSGSTLLMNFASILKVPFFFAQFSSARYIARGPKSLPPIPI